MSEKPRSRSEELHELLSDLGRCVQEAVTSARATYVKMGVEDKLGLYLQPNAGHVFTPVAELVMGDWFARWLQP